MRMLKESMGGDVPGYTTLHYVINSIEFGKDLGGGSFIQKADVTLDQVILGKFVDYLEDGNGVPDPDEGYRSKIQFTITDPLGNGPDYNIVKILWAEGKGAGQEMSMKTRPWDQFQLQFEDFVSDKLYSEFMKFDPEALKESKKLDETRTLVELKGYYDQGNWFFRWEGGRVSLTGTAPEMIAKLFQAGQVKDAATAPRSRRNKTYGEMVSGIMTGEDRLSWIWSNYIPVFKAFAAKLGGIF